MNKFSLIITSVCALFVAGLREQFCTANVETAAGTHAGSFGRRADAGAALNKKYLLYKKGSDERHVTVCGAADYPVGSSGDEAGAAEDLIHIAPLAGGDTRLLRCATALGDDIDVYTAAGGLVQAEPALAGTYYKVGRTVATAVQEGTNDYHIAVAPIEPIKLVVAAQPGTVGAIAAAMNGAQLVKFLP